MDSRKVVFQETAIVAIGEAIASGITVGVFALLGFFDLSVVWGSLIGAVLSVLNFFVMAIVVSLAADKAAGQDVEGGKKLIKSAYPLRLLVLAVLLIAFGKSGFCNVIALVLPLLFVRPILTFAEFFRKKGA